MFTPNDYAIAVLAIVAVVALIYVVLFWPSARLPAPWPRRTHRGRYAIAPDLRDAGQQLNAVMAASFERRRVLSLSEFRAFRVIEADLAASREGYRVFAQTCLGEVLSSPDDDAFRSINSKRVDFLIVDRGGWPVVAIEYQGDGHFQGNAPARDAVKKEALRKAGVRYVEIWPNDSADQIRSRVREQLNWPIEQPPCHHPWPKSATPFRSPSGTVSS